MSSGDLAPLLGITPRAVRLLETESVYHHAPATVRRYLKALTGAEQERRQRFLAFVTPLLLAVDTEEDERRRK